MDQISSFDENSNFWQEFRSLTKFSIFNENFNVWHKFRFFYNFLARSEYSAGLATKSKKIFFFAQKISQKNDFVWPHCGKTNGQKVVIIFINQNERKKYSRITRVLWVWQRKWTKIMPTKSRWEFKIGIGKETRVENVQPTFCRHFSWGRVVFYSIFDQKFWFLHQFLINISISDNKFDF